MSKYRKTRIVCTTGPATMEKPMLEKLVKAGMNVARLNMSHGIHPEKQRIIEDLREIRERLDVPLAVLVDIEGPKIRTGKLKTEYVELKKGAELVLTTDEIVGDEKKMSVSYKELPTDVKTGDTILLSDGMVGLKVLSTTEKEIKTEILNTGRITHNRGINVPGVDLSLPPLTDKDVEDLKFASRMRPEYIAQSFVRKPEDIVKVRNFLKEQGMENVRIIAKIETKQALDNLEEILDVSDGAMVARGDLGVEIASEDLPLAQKRIIKLCNARAIPVITATQMLESMISNPRPTRAEITDIANAVLDGTDGVMLSEETAMGSYPIQAVEYMDKIARKAEDFLVSSERSRVYSVDKLMSTRDAISMSAWRLSVELGTDVIVASTNSGYTARHVSRFRPSATVFSPTPSFETYNALALIWGTVPVVVNRVESTDEMIESAVEKLVGLGLSKAGEKVVITAGVPWGIAGNTNLLKVHEI